MSRQAFKVLAGAATAVVIVATAGQAAAQTYYQAAPTASTPAPGGYDVLYQSNVGVNPEYPGAYPTPVRQQPIASQYGAPQAPQADYQYYGGQQQSPYVYGQAAPASAAPSYAYQGAVETPQAQYSYQGTYPQAQQQGYLGDTGAVGGYQQQSAYQPQSGYQQQSAYQPQESYQQTLPYGQGQQTTNIGYNTQPAPTQPAYSAPAQTAYAAPTHYIQVAALTKMANAERLKQGLVARGENAFIAQAYVNGRDFHRVRIPASSVADARAVLQRVRAMGHADARVVRR